MLRGASAAATLARTHSHQTFALASAAAAATAGTAGAAAYAACASAPNGEDDRRPSSAMASSSSLALVMPTMQAVLRASRLLGTAVLMASDYQRLKWSSVELDHPLFRLLSPPPPTSKRKTRGVNGDDDDNGGGRRKDSEEEDEDDEEDWNPTDAVLRAVTALRTGLDSDLSSGSQGDDNCDADDNPLEVEAGNAETKEDLERLRSKWERIVERRTLELEEAQRLYTTPDEENDGDDDTPHTTAEVKQARVERQKRLKKAVQTAARSLADAEETLASLGDRRSDVHRKAARRLLELCRTNGGTYIKVGQHLANLDLLIPVEYVEVLSSLFDDAPVSTYDDVRAVVKEDLGAYPEELFDSFSTQPIASASLAQVHTAIERRTGRKLAIKVQHRGLRETSRGDLFAMELAVKAAEWAFDEFTLGWLVDEISPQLPRELDFANEGRNAERAAAHLSRAKLDCCVPKILWDQTSDRVLCMEFEEGFNSTDVDSIRKAGLNRKDVAELISSVFNAQIFQNGFVHCDPHPANVLLREHPEKKGKPELVLVDHGLYKQLDGDFRLTYAKLWKSLLVADIRGIKHACEDLGVHEMYPLLAAMLTSRPFDEVLERSKNGSVATASAENDRSGDTAMIRGYAQRYIKEIISMLDTVPRQMLLLFKMNDCLRHVDYALGSPTNTLVVAGKYASRAVYENERYEAKGSFFRFLHSWLEHCHVLLKIRAYELAGWWNSLLQPRITQ